MLQDIFQVANHTVLRPGPQIIVGVMKPPHVKVFPIYKHTRSFRTDSRGFTAFIVAALAHVTSPALENRGLRPSRRPDCTTFLSAPAQRFHPRPVRFLDPITISGTGVSLFTYPELSQECFFLSSGYRIFSASLLSLVTPSNSLCPRLTTLPHSQEHTAYLFSSIRQPKAFKDNDNLLTAILSCKEFARFAGTGSYRNVLLVLCGLDSLEGQESTGDTDM